MIRRSVRRKKHSEKLDYWQSYSDIMSSLLLTFVLILSGTLVEMRITYEEKQAELEAQEKIIEQQQEQIDEILSIRTDLIETLQEEFANSEYNISIDSQTGAIMFDSNLLFNSGSAGLKMEGLEFLDSFLPKYFSIILSDEFAPSVSEIIIEGHTDTIGGYMMNLLLSQSRAISVVQYCLDTEHGLLTEEEIIELRGLLTANGKSWSMPIYNEDGTVNLDASRRVEIKFRLKDEEMMAQLEEILGGSNEK